MKYSAVRSLVIDEEIIKVVNNFLETRKFKDIFPFLRCALNFARNKSARLWNNIYIFLLKCHLHQPTHKWTVSRLVDNNSRMQHYSGFTVPSTIPGTPGNGMFPGLPGPGQIPHPSLLGATIPQMPPGFNPSTLTLAERLAGKFDNQFLTRICYTEEREAWLNQPISRDKINVLYINL